MKFKLYYIFLLSVCAAIYGCSSRTNHRQKLEIISNNLTKDPQQALLSLDNLKESDFAAMTESDQKFYDFLYVKASDQTYCRHESDSLINQVFDYYKSHDTHGVYPEALYYAGRVCSDIGDYPTALNHFLNALGNTPDSDIDLRRRILSQLGRILDTIRLYDKALPYVKEACLLDSLDGDTIALMYDTSLLGSIHLHKKQYDEALPLSEKARRLAEKVSPEDAGSMDIHIAALKYYKHDLPGAQRLIGQVLKDVNPLDRHTALSYACRIYSASGLNDSAYICADELIHNRYPENKIVGYSTLFSPELRKIIPADSVDSYNLSYERTVDEYIDRNADKGILIQDSYFNYVLHEQARKKAERSNRVLTLSLISVSFLILLLAIIILWQKNRHARTILKLREFARNLEKLQKRMKSETPDGCSGTGTFDEKTHCDEMEPLPPHHSSSSDSETIALLKKHIEENIARMADEVACAKASDKIRNSEIYSILQERLDRDTPIGIDNNLWGDLERQVLECSPDFYSRLEFLLQVKPDIMLKHVALLIKCGLSPTDAAKLTGRTKQTISYYRKTLRTAMRKTGIGSDDIDRLIQSF